MIVFSNLGTLDLRALKTMGLSVKTNDNPIGYFGTGMKYAVAIFIRLGFEVRLVTGGKSYVFGSKTVDSRGKDFEIVTMNDEELPFTTHLGANWEPWQAFRELYCNALDEGGSCFWAEPTNDYALETNGTYFMVNGTDAKVLFNQRDDIVLDCEFTTENKFAQGIAEKSEWVFYRGIRVMKRSEPFINTYNIKEHMTLTEDRTIKDPSLAMMTISRAVAASDDKKFIRRAITCGKLYSEFHLGFIFLDWSSEKYTDEFLEVATEEFENNNDNLNNSVRLWVKKLKEKDTIKNIINYVPDDSEQQMFKIAIGLVKRQFRTDRYEFIFSETLGENTMAYVHMNLDENDNRIFISKKCFDKGLLYLTSTILEEVVHKETGYMDETRELQTYLFEEMTKLLAKKSGHHVEIL